MQLKFSNHTQSQPAPTNAQVAADKTLADNTQQLLKIAAFIDARQQQKSALTSSIQQNKNSLSKEKLTKLKKDQETTENSHSSQALYKLLALLSEQLNDGHTVYQLPSSNARQQALFEIWQAQHWLSVIDDKVTPQHISTPIVMQFVNAISSNHISHDTNDDKGCVFWLHRQWYAEYQLANNLLKIATRPVTHLMTGATVKAVKQSQSMLAPNAQQQCAIDNASQFGFSIITGGPGTGKTFTVAQLVTRLQAKHEAKRAQDPNLPPLSIALTAPTGKAAQRMQASLAQSLGSDDKILDNAKTLHRLLGMGQGSEPRYHAKNPLPDDLVIVDEASMLGLELASLLVDAIKPSGRLILLGDANQLSAVDAGSVLADLCQVPALQPYRTQLVESVRFDKDSVIGQLATALQAPATNRQTRAQKLKDTHRLLAFSSLATDATNPPSQPNDNTTAIPFYAITDTTPMRAVYQRLAKPYSDFFELMRQWYIRCDNLEETSVRQRLFQTFDSYRILTAGHQGQLGAQVINKMMVSAFFDQTHLSRTRELFFHGAPIMVTRNDYQLGLFNGDIGVCVTFNNTLVACFADKIVPTNRLSRENCEHAYAMTIHKSQGSEFNAVAICLDKQHARLLSQELVYTAVTRSRQQVMIVSSPAVFDRAILQKGNRQTGLPLQFARLAQHS